MRRARLAPSIFLMRHACAVLLILASCLMLAMPSTAPAAGPQKDRKSVPAQRQGARPVPPGHARPLPPPRTPPPPPRVQPPDWHHGYWHHGWHHDRIGWWWVVGPSWYFISTSYPWWDPWPPREVIVVERSEPVGPPPPAYWYRCEQPSGYYPYVRECPGGWTPVPATPPDVAP